MGPFKGQEFCIPGIDQAEISQIKRINEVIAFFILCYNQRMLFNSISFCYIKNDPYIPNKLQSCLRNKLVIVSRVYFRIISMWNRRRFDLYRVYESMGVALYVSYS